MLHYFYGKSQDYRTHHDVITLEDAMRLFSYASNEEPQVIGMTLQPEFGPVDRDDFEYRKLRDFLRVIQHMATEGRFYDNIYQRMEFVRIALETAIKITSLLRENFDSVSDDLPLQVGMMLSRYARDDGRMALSVMIVVYHGDEFMNLGDQVKVPPYMQIVGF